MHVEVRGVKSGEFVQACDEHELVCVRTCRAGLFLLELDSLAAKFLVDPDLELLHHPVELLFASEEELGREEAPERSKEG